MLVEKSMRHGNRRVYTSGDRVGRKHVMRDNDFNRPACHSLPRPVTECHITLIRSASAEMQLIMSSSIHGQKSHTTAYYRSYCYISVCIIYMKKQCTLFCLTTLTYTYHTVDWLFIYLSLLLRISVWNYAVLYCIRRQSSNDSSQR